MSMAPFSCLSLNPAVPRDPGSRPSLFTGSRGEGGGLGEGAATSPVSTLVPPDCPLLGWSQTLPKSLSEAFWGKELGGLGLVF